MPFEVSITSCYRWLCESFKLKNHTAFGRCDEFIGEKYIYTLPEKVALMRAREKEVPTQLVCLLLCNSAGAGPWRFKGRASHLPLSGQILSWECRGGAGSGNHATFILLAGTLVCAVPLIMGHLTQPWLQRWPGWTPWSWPEKSSHCENVPSLES